MVFRRLYLWKIVIILLLFSSTGIGSSVYGKSHADSVTTDYISTLSGLYRQGKLSDAQYIDTVNRTMELLLSRDIHFSNSRLLDLMGTYRRVVWQQPDNEKLKQDYYMILNSQAKNAGRLGEMLYYAVKINELEEKRLGQPSIASLTFIADYYNNNGSFQNTLSLYKKHRQFLEGLPRQAADKQIAPEDLKRVGTLLYCFAGAALKSNDSIAGKAVIRLIDKIAEVIGSHYTTDRDAVVSIRYVQLLAAYEWAVTQRDGEGRWKAIQALELLALDKETPEYLKNYMDFAITDKKIVYFLEYNKPDSSSHYLQVIKGLYTKKDNPFNDYMIKKYMSYSLYNQGLYRQSLDTLKDAVGIMETLRSNSATEINDLMYTLARVEEQQLVLEQLKEQQQKTARQLFYAGIGFVVLLLGGLYAFRVARYRQVKKFLEFKLSLARNIHDEANPALLYAKALARTERMNNGMENKTELEHHIDDTMELLRSLSYDLQTDRQHGIPDLLKETDKLLCKLNPDNEFNYKIKNHIDEGVFLSHFQYTQLSAMLKECISNTLKHADFSNIFIEVTQHHNKVSVRYIDDGKGWPETVTGKGIGLKNMEVRARKMNGEFRLSNNYPEGYFLEVIFKLH